MAELSPAPVMTEELAHRIEIVLKFADIVITEAGNCLDPQKAEENRLAANTMRATQLTESEAHKVARRVINERIRFAVAQIRGPKGPS